MIKFINIEDFLSWYNENAEIECLDIDALLEEVVERYGETGIPQFVSIVSKDSHYHFHEYQEYELSSFDSKDGHPHLYGYSYDCYIQDDENDCSIIEEIFEF